MAEYALSSKSEKRFLVNFHTKNAIIPITATPPATARPMIEPVPRPELSLSLSLAAVGVPDADVDEVVDAELVTTVVTTVLPLCVVTT